MVIKPVYPSPPPAPVHRVEERTDARREQRERGKPAGTAPAQRHEDDDGQPHVDAYA